MCKCICDMNVTAEEVLDHDFDHVAVATGSTWRSDGVGRQHDRAIPISADAEILTPDDLLSGLRPRGNRVVVFDDDHYYLGGSLAELLAAEGFEVEIVTPEPLVSAWTVNTLEQGRIHRRLLEVGVGIHTQESVCEVGDTNVTVECVVTGHRHQVDAESVVMVTARTPDDALAVSLSGLIPDTADAARPCSVTAVGDAFVPSTIASAVWWGHRYARELEEDPATFTFRRE